MRDSPRIKTCRPWMHTGVPQRPIPRTQMLASAVARLEEILRLDPTRRGLSVRERARRWDEILQRVLAAVAACGPSPEIEKAKPLLKKRSVSLEVSDQKMQTALSIWKGAPASCKTDAVLTHILSKLGESPTEDAQE